MVLLFVKLMEGLLVCSAFYTVLALCQHVPVKFESMFKTVIINRMLSISFIYQNVIISLGIIYYVKCRNNKPLLPFAKNVIPPRGHCGFDLWPSKLNSPPLSPALSSIWRIAFKAMGWMHLWSQCPSSLTFDRQNLISLSGHLSQRTSPSTYRYVEGKVFSVVCSAQKTGCNFLKALRQNCRASLFYFHGDWFHSRHFYILVIFISFYSTAFVNGWSEGKNVSQLS